MVTHKVPGLFCMYFFSKTFPTGSKQNSNIDAEVSFVGEDERSKHSKRNTSGSSQRASRVRTAQNSSTVETSAAHSKQGSDTSQPEGTTSNSVQPSGRKASSRKPAAASAERTARRKTLEESPVPEETAFPVPAETVDPKSGSSSKGKRAASPKKKKSPPGGSKDNLSVIGSSRRGQNRSRLDASATTSALGLRSTAVSDRENVPSSAAGNAGQVVEAPVKPKKGAGSSFRKDSGRAANKSKISKEINGGVSHGSTSGRAKAQALLSSSEVVASSAADRRKRVSSSIDADSEASGPSPRKRGRPAMSQEARTASKKPPRTKKQPPPPVPSSRSTQRTKKASSSTRDSSVLDREVTAASPSSYIHAPPLKSRNTTQTVQKLSESPKRFFSDPERSPQKLVANKIVGVKTTQRKGTTMASNSFWKTSRRISSELKPQRQQMAVSVSSVYDDDTVSMDNTHTLYICADTSNFAVGSGLGGGGGELLFKFQVHAHVE